MIVIRRTDSHITCDGHAGNEICCAMLSALTTSFVEDLTERSNLNVDYTLEFGKFDIDLNTIPGFKSDIIESYWFSLNSLARSYPENFKIV